MGFLESPKLLYFVRLLQIFFSTAFLVLVCFAGTHRGWWNNLDGPLALGSQSPLSILPLYFSPNTTTDQISSHRRPLHLRCLSPYMLATTSGQQPLLRPRRNLYHCPSNHRDPYIPSLGRQRSIGAPTARRV